MGMHYIKVRSDPAWDWLLQLSLLALVPVSIMATTSVSVCIMASVTFDAGTEQKNMRLCLFLYDIQIQNDVFTNT